MEGYFEGNYRGGFLAVPKGGKYVGVADVRRADIGGRLHGTLSARTLLEVRGRDGVGWERMAWDEMGKDRWNAIGCDRRDGMGWDGTGGEDGMR